jgi:hypothetical protein
MLCLCVLRFLKNAYNGIFCKRKPIKGVPSIKDHVLRAMMNLKVNK